MESLKNKRRISISKALLAGHFSTIGDLESLEIVQGWLKDLGIAYDVVPFSDSVREKLTGALDFHSIDPMDYSHVVLICGPVWKAQLADLGIDLSRFSHCLLLGINLTLVTPVTVWNPFDVLLERDSDRCIRPDLTLFLKTKTVPVVVGRCMVRRQSSYAGRERHDRAREVFDAVIQRHHFAALDFDTRWYREQNGLNTPAQFVAALQRIDLLFTNRLHGMVYALKAGVPVVAIDAIKGGAKVSAQARTLGWPQCIPVDEVTPKRLEAAIEWCLSPLAKEKIAVCRDRVRPRLIQVKQKFFNAMRHGAATNGRQLTKRSLRR